MNIFRENWYGHKAYRTKMHLLKRNGAKSCLLNDRGPFQEVLL